MVLTVVTRPPITEPKLAHELIMMQRENEEAAVGFQGTLGMIRQLPPDVQQQLLDRDQVDLRHTARLKQIIARYGWPTVRMVGRQGAHAALEVVRRSNEDNAFQARALDLVVKSGEGDKEAIARLVDDVAVARGEPQTYGTQYTCRDGELVLATPIKDIGDGLSLTQRRATMDLPPNEIEQGEDGFKRGLICDPTFFDQSGPATTLR